MLVTITWKAGAVPELRTVIVKVKTPPRGAVPGFTDRLKKLLGEIVPVAVGVGGVPVNVGVMVGVSVTVGVTVSVVVAVAVSVAVEVAVAVSVTGSW